MNESVLVLKNVRKEFSGINVVDNISFEVKKGDIMGTLGPNGAGKSTLIRNIMGIIYPDSGDIKFNLSNGSEDRFPLEKIGYLPEERGLYKDVSIQDIIFYLSDLKSYPREKAKKRLKLYLEKLDLKGMEKRKIEELSKGMAQKVQFIGAIIHEPELLILDEPFSGLDPVSQDVFREEILNLSKEGTTILLSSHQMNLVEALCNRIFLINKGKEVIYGSLEDVKDKYGSFKCIIHGKNNRSDIEKLKGINKLEFRDEKNMSIIELDSDIMPVDFLNSIPKNIDIKEIHMDKISLHDIFVNIAKGGKSDE